MVINQEIILIIIFIVIVYFNYKINKLEQKSLEEFTITEETKTEIKTQIKQIYLADVEAIRILSNFAIQLSQGGFTVPGNIKCTDTISAINGIRITDSENNRNGIFTGTDGCEPDKCNTIIKSWYGLGFAPSYPTLSNTKSTIWFDVRNGNMNAKGSIYAGPNNEAFLQNGTVYGSNGIRVGGSAGQNYEGMFRGIGTGGANYDNFNMQIRSYHGLGFVCSQNIENKEANIWFDLTTGTINCRKINIVGDKGTIVSSWDKDKLNVTSKAKLNIIGLAGYVFNVPNMASDTPQAYPIICSMHHAVSGANDSDDTWLINPGYKVVVYQDFNYGGELQTFDNYNGEKAVLFYKNSNQYNSTSSWKVYFNNDNNEVTVDKVS